MKAKMTVLEMVLCALFAALIAVGAFIKIETGGVPITFQTLFVMLAGLILGSRLGSISVFVYIFIGLIGVPVFTRGGGIWYVLQPTFGYLLGFGLGAYVSGLIVERLPKKSIFTYLAGAVAALVSVYIVALPFLYFLLNFYLGKPTSVDVLWKSYCFGFLPNDMLSAVIASLLAKTLRPIVWRTRRDA